MHGGSRLRSSMKASTTAATRIDGRPGVWNERLSGGWDRAITVAIDIGLVTAAIAGVLTHDVVLWFHIIFVLVIIAALELPFRPFALRLAVWSVVSTGLVIWAVTELATPSQELLELPILTFVLVLVFLVAQSRGRSLDRLQRTQRDAQARAELERETMQTQLEQSQRLDLLGRASAKTAHEMRSVLTIVRGCAAELGDEHSPSIRHKAAELVDAVDRGLEMLDELSAAGRANRTVTGTLDLTLALRQTESLLVHLVHDGIEMRCAVPSGRIEVEFDRTSFTQVVMNLVANAVDAVGDRGTIGVAVREVHRHRNSVAGLERCALIEVVDSGAGMVATDDGDVFDAGFTTKGDTHSGLGLSMVWQIAARAGGTVEIDSNPGTGTTVSVFLPLAKPEHRTKRCVLDVEDERAMSMISHEFALLGYEVHRADEIEPDHALAADVAVVDEGCSGIGSIDFGTTRVIHLNGAGPWKSPSTSAEATQLVRRVLMDTSPLPR